MTGSIIVPHQQVYVSKWITFASSALLQSSAGLAYSFSVYAPAVKDALGLSQTQVATVGSAVNLGGYFAILSGHIYDSLKDYHALGPRLVVWLGSLCCLCGYMGMFLMVAGHAPHSYGQLLVFAAAAGNMGVWFDTSALVTSVRNFPNDRGFVVGVLKSFLGLSSSLYTSVYACAFEPDATRYLLMLALVPSALGLLLSAGLNYVPFVETSEACHATTQRRFLQSFLMVGALALYQMASAVLQAAHPFGRAGRTAIVATMVALLGLAALLPLRCSGSWRAAYAHPYIHTRESQADDDDEGGGGGNGGRHHGGSPRGRRHSHGSPLPGFTSVPHQRVAVGQLRTLKGADGGPGAGPGPSGASGLASSSSSSLAGPGRAPPRSRPGTAGAGAHGLPPPGAAGHHGGGGGSSSGGRDGGGGHAALSVAHHAGGNEPHEAAPLLGLHARGDGGGDGPLPPTALLLGGKGSGGSSPASLSPLPRPQGGGGGGGGDAREPALQLGSLTTRQMLCTLNFWLLFVQFTVASGVSLAYLNNLGQLVVALGGHPDGQVVFVSLFSVANAAGRLLAGYIPEQYLHARGTPRTLFLTLTAALLAAASLATAYASLAHLYVISLLIGLAFGAHWSLLPAITSDLFGLKHFAANYTTLQFAPAAGSYLLATRLTGWLYDRAAAAHGDPHACVGSDCFREAFLLLSGCAGLSSLACSAATSRSRRAYQALAQHLRQVDTAGGGGGGGGDGGGDHH